jgi:DNA-binding response OmpR family regulator
MIRPTPLPFIALVDDDAHSARLITRMLLAHGAPTIHWLDGAAAGAAEIGDMLASPQAERPALVIVDLKANSGASCDFIRGLRGLEGGTGLLIVAMASTLDREIRDRLVDAGADAVFERHADSERYRREVASIVSFWVRNQRLSAIGA